MATLEQLIEDSVERVLRNILKEDVAVDENSEPLYHVTYLNRLDGISGAGLRSGMGRSIGAPAYDAHAAKGVFLAEEDGVHFWFNRAEDFATHNSDNPLEDGLVPVVLRVNPQGFSEDELADDELGSKDAMSDAYIHPGIDPEHIDVWDGNSWIPVDDWDSIDPEQAFEMEEDEETGENYAFFRDDNPLMP